jgi:hypothetical protein
MKLHTGVQAAGAGWWGGGWRGRRGAKMVLGGCGCGRGAGAARPPSPQLGGRGTKQGGRKAAGRGAAAVARPRVCCGTGEGRLVWQGQERELGGGRARGPCHRAGRASCKMKMGRGGMGAAGGGLVCGPAGSARAEPAPQRSCLHGAPGGARPGRVSFKAKGVFGGRAGARARRGRPRLRRRPLGVCHRVQGACIVKKGSGAFGGFGVGHVGLAGLCTCTWRGAGRRGAARQQWLRWARRAGAALARGRRAPAQRRERVTGPCGAGATAGGAPACCSAASGNLRGWPLGASTRTMLDCGRLPVVRLPAAGWVGGWGGVGSAGGGGEGESGSGALRRAPGAATARSRPAPPRPAAANRAPAPAAHPRPGRRGARARRQAPWPQAQPRRRR